MKKWASLLLYFFFLQSYAQYSYTYTDPCTLQLKSVFVPAGGGVMVNYFDNHNTFTALDFSSGAFDNWIALVSQQNSNAPCQSVTTVLTNNITSTVVSNTVGIVTNVVAISSLAQSMASISSSVGSSMSATAGGVSNISTVNPTDNNLNSNDKSNNNTSTGTNTGTTGTSSASNSSQTSQTPSSTSGGTSAQPSTGTLQQGGSTTSTDQSTSTGSTTSEPSIGTDSGNSSSGNTANSISNSIDGGSGEGSGSSSGSSKKQSNAKASTGSLIASGDMVVISPTDSAERNQYKFVGSITHANTRGTRIKGVLFNFTTGANNINVTLYKSWINKKRSLNTIVASSTMMDFDKNLFNTTTALESYKLTKKFTTMFGMNFTLGKMGERSFYNISAVGGGHGSFDVSKKVSTSILALLIYSPFTQFYEGRWWDAGILVVPFSSWDFKITKTFKYNVSVTAVYSYGDRFLNYQILTGGKISF